MQSDFSTQTTLTVTTVSRPKRVAFLVDPNISDPTNIDELIRFSTNVWGGRYHAIIPTSGVEIEHDWWQLLLALDPDVIDSLVPLDQKLINRINKYILPSQIIEFTPEELSRGDGRYHANTFDIAALSIEDLPGFVWETRLSLREPYFIYVKDGPTNSESTSFIVRNFGSLSGTLPMNDAFRELPHDAIELKSTTAEAFMQKILPLARNAVFPIDLCQSQAYLNYSLGHHRDVTGFHLVVGDSALDVMYSWNRALISEGYSGRDFLWLSQDLANDERFLKLAGDWIRRTFWANSPDRFGKVISYSLDEANLKKIAEKISAEAMLPFEGIHLSNDQFPFPSVYQPAFDKKPESHTFQVSLSEDRCLVGIPRPRFLKGGHPQYGWMVDCWIQYHPERHKYTNGRPDWILPKRLGLSNIFFEYNKQSRVIDGGLPSVAVTTADKSINVKIPSDRAVIWTCLFHDEIDNTKKERVKRDHLFRDIQTSDKGQYLQGLIKLFENVYYAGYIFEDPFWRHVLLKMAGRPADVKDDSAKRKSIILGEIGKLFTEDPTPIVATSPRLEKIANTLAGRLLFRDAEPLIVTKKNLIDLFRNLKNERLKIRPPSEYWQREQFDESKLQDLLDQRVILQGAEITCPFCRTKQWYYVDRLLSEMQCNGCQIKFPLPMTPEWSFRLNNLALNALKKHGTLAVLQALYQLLYFTPRMFLFLPCQDVYKKGKNEAFTDLDLIYINDGKFTIGEVKSSPDAFTDFKKLIEVARDVLPDEVIIAAQGNEWPAKTNSEIEKFRQEMKSFDIQVTPVLLKWYYGD